MFCWDNIGLLKLFYKASLRLIREFYQNVCKWLWNDCEIFVFKRQDQLNRILIRK